MNTICVRNSNNEIIAGEVAIATRFFQRARGLLFSEPLKEGSGLWINPCNAVHTFFMTYSIDVVFLDKNMRIINILENMSPWQVSPIVKNALSVLELPAGTAKKYSVTIGEQLVF